METMMEVNADRIAGYSERKNLNFSESSAADVGIVFFCQ